MLKLLIADDERIIRETIFNIIDWKKHDIEVIGLCKNGIEAYDMILDESPDIVLTDIRMPGMGGLELIRKIRQTDLQIQFIILSGYGEFEYAKEAMSYGIRHYLLKPCNETQILECIEQCRKDHEKQARERKMLQQQFVLYDGMFHSVLSSIINDCLDEKMTLEEIIATARERGLDAVCITDHDSMGLKETAEQYSRETGFPIFVGVDYFSLWGDITAFGIDRFPDKRIPAQDFVDQVNAAGGFCVACHPFRNNNRGFEDHLWEIQGLHGVEVLNGSTDMEANRKALSICKARNMQMVGASDAHWTSQLGKYATMVPGEPKDLEEFVAALHKGGLKPAIYEEGKGYRIVDTF